MSLQFDDIKSIECKVCPSKRGFFGMCCDSVHNTVYSFGGACGTGGFDDLWRLNVNDIDGINWKKMNKTDKWPKGRGGCTLDYYDNNLILIGGYIKKTEPFMGALIPSEKMHFDDVWRYDIKRNKWENINTLQFKIFLHETVVYKHFIILAQGLQVIDKYDAKEINELYIYNMDYNELKKVNCKNKPKPRYLHSMAICNDTLFIHGGRDHSKNVFDDAYCVDLKSVLKSDNPTWRKVNLNVPGLFGHSLLSVNNKQLIVYGGVREGGNFNEYITIFNDMNYPHYGKTSKIDTKYQRYYHESCLFYLKNTLYMFIFGGAGKDDINEQYPNVLISIKSNNNNNNFNNNNNENIRLKKENDALKTEVERLRRAMKNIRISNIYTVKQFLDSIELDQYYYKFVHHGYDTLTDFDDITTEILKEIGIHKFGHRNRILKEYKKLKNNQ